MGLAHPSRFIDESLHAALEVGGAVIAVSAAATLLLRPREREATRFSDVLAAGLLALGVLDALHGAQPPGDAFALLRACGTALGGACFALVWLPDRALAHLRVLPWAALALALALGIGASTWTGLPRAFLEDGRLRPALVALSAAGGVAFLAAAARLALAWRARRERTDLAFAVQCALLGAAGVSFTSPTSGDPTWWTWHVLRFAAFAVAFASILAGSSASGSPARLAEERFRALVEIAPVGIALLGSDGRFSFANETCRRLLGRSEREIVGSEPWALLEDGIDGAASETRTSTRTLARDGRATAVEVRTRRTKGPHGPMALVVLTDVSEAARQRDELEARAAELKSANALAQRSAAFFRLTFDAAPTGMLLVDSGGTIVKANRHVCELFGYGEDELAGRAVEELVPARLRERHPLLRKAYLADPEQRAMGSGRELFGVGKAGAEIPVEIGLNPVETPDGTFVLASVADVRERVRRREARDARSREHALAAELNQRAAERVHAVVEAASSGMLLVDRLGYVVMANSCAARIFGYARGELLGRPVDSLVPASSRAAHARMRAAFLEAPIPRAVGSGRELRGVRKDGSEVPVEIGLSPVATDDGVHVLASVLDISERIAHVRELQRKSEELARSNADLNDFAYAASHDLRAPLRAIENLATWIEEDAGSSLPESSRRHLATLRGRIQRMDRLLSDLLEYSRAGRPGAPPIDLDVRRLVDEVVELLSPPPGFVVDADEDLPHVVASRAPLEQVLRNLIANAIKHHDRGEGRIHVSARELDEAVEFTVADDGPGIPPEFRERAFRMFQTLKPRDEVEGSGLGLALVRKTVLSNHGEVHIAQREGRGTHVVFTWPKQSPSAGEGA